MRGKYVRLWVPYRGRTCLCSNSNNAQGQETPVGNQRGERRNASSPERRGQRQARFASVGWEAIALGMSWVGWHRPKARRGQQRRGYSDRTSERSRHLVGARRVREAMRGEKRGVRRP